MVIINRQDVQLANEIKAIRDLAAANVDLGQEKAAETAGLAIKKSHPILQVAVYDGVASINKLIELP